MSPSALGYSQLSASWWTGLGHAKYLLKKMSEMDQTCRQLQGRMEEDLEAESDLISCSV